MTEEKAKQIGIRQGLISVGVGLLIAQLIMTFLSSEKGLLNGFLWFIDFHYNLNLVICIVIMATCGYFFGQQAGVEILIKDRNFKWVGIKYGFATLMTTAFLSSWTGFFQEGVNKIGTNDNPFNDYIFKPLFWVFFFGLIPVLIVGYWFGRQINKHQTRD